MDIQDAMKAIALAPLITIQRRGSGIPLDGERILLELCEFEESFLHPGVAYNLPGKRIRRVEPRAVYQLEELYGCLNEYLDPEAIPVGCKREWSSRELRDLAG
jgi:hypothetical protein